MATRLALGLTVGAALWIAACTGTRPPPPTGQFAFEYEGTPYAIISTEAIVGEGNVLLRRAHPFLRADDRDQDGRLDTVVAGNLTLAQANQVYAAGLAQAEARGKRQERVLAPTFTVELSGGACTIQTLRSRDGQLFNRFVCIAAAQPQPVIALDNEADGVLDRLEQGSTRLDSLQTRYAFVLQRGIGEGRVERRDGAFWVLGGAATATKRFGS